MIKIKIGVSKWFDITFVHLRPFHETENIYDLFVSYFVKRTPELPFVSTCKKGVS